MKIQIDLKSAVFGLIIGAAAMFVMGADSPSNSAGRYQISAGQSSGFIVDTQTGQAWGFQPVNSSQYRQDANFFTPKTQ